MLIRKQLQISTRLLKMQSNSIIDISVINADLPMFRLHLSAMEKKYVYRHPGGTAGNLIDRQSELLHIGSKKDRY